MSQSTGYFIRNTLINYSHLATLPEESQKQIKELTAKFNQIGYIDATTQIGPDQWARTSAKQRDKLSAITLQAFEIEGQIKQLLKPESQLQQEAEEATQELRKRNLSQIQNRINQIEQFLKRKLDSNRENPTKKEYRELQSQLITLQQN